MTSPATTQDAAALADGAETSAPATKSKGPLLFIIVGALVGTGAGLFGLAPLVITKQASAAHAKAAEVHPAEAPVMVALDNLVLNPAQSNGERFLMVSAAIEVRTKAVEEDLKSRTPKVRDRILTVLGTKTVEQLTDMTQREGIKAEVLAAIAGMFTKGDVVTIYFPQFVVQ